MRMVYDDTRYEEAKREILTALSQLNPASISRYSYGMYRADSSKIKDEVLRIINSHGCRWRFGNTTHAHGIGNNNATEIIFLGNPNERQICGLFHANEDMYSGCFCYVTDVFGEQKSIVKKIQGRE